MQDVLFGLEQNITALILSGFFLSFGLWAVSRAVALVFQLAGSRSGVKPI